MHPGLKPIHVLVGSVHDGSIVSSLSHGTPVANYCQHMSGQNKSTGVFF